MITGNDTYRNKKTNKLCYLLDIRGNMVFIQYKESRLQRWYKVKVFNARFDPVNSKIAK